VERELPGTFAIGHTRYSTVAKTERNSAVYQPLRGQYGGEPFCLAHNGNLTNKTEFALKLGMPELAEGLDTELIVKSLEQSATGSFENDLCEVLRSLRGSFALLILFKNALYAARDAQGNRPLVVGANPRSYVFASETCALETLDAEFLSEIEAGTFVRTDGRGLGAPVRFAPANERRCAFEPVYFSHHAGDTFGVPLLEFRIRLGMALEEECPAPADIVLGVPDSASVIGMGYGRSGRSGTFVPALVRHHHAGGRTFILPSQDRREAAVRRKFQSARSTIAGKRVALVDDSIVRATTMRLLVRRIRLAGAKEVHVRSAFPPIKHPCRYGIDTPDKSELIAARHSVAGVRDYIRADSLEYLSMERLLSVLGGDPGSWCTACINGKYWD